MGHDTDRPKKVSFYIEKLVFRKTNSNLVQLIRYAVVSGISLFVDFLLLYIFTEYLGVHYLISALFGYAVGLVINYLLSVLWIFDVRRYRKKSIEFGLFVLIGVFGMGLNEILMWFFTDLLALFYMLSRVVSALVGFITKYYARKIFLFSRSDTMHS